VTWDEIETAAALVRSFPVIRPAMKGPLAGRPVASSAKETRPSPPSLLSEPQPALASIGSPWPVSGPLRTHRPPAASEASEDGRSGRRPANMHEAYNHAYLSQK
jgi:hypothetical protein